MQKIDVLIAELVGKNNWEEEKDIARLNISVTDFKKLLSVIMVKDHTDVIPICLKFFHLMIEIDRKDLERFIIQVANLENHLAMGTINLLAFFYKYLELNLIEVICRCDKIEQEKRLHILDYLVYTPLHLSVDEITINRHLALFNTDRALISFYKNHLLDSGIKKAESVDRNHLIPAWAKKLKIV